MVIRNFDRRSVEVRLQQNSQTSTKYWFSFCHFERSNFLFCHFDDPRRLVKGGEIYRSLLATARRDDKGGENARRDDKGGENARRDDKKGNPPVFPKKLKS